MNGSPAMKPDGNVSAKTVVVQWKSVAIGCDTAIHTVIVNAPDLTNLDKSPQTALRAFNPFTGETTLQNPNRRSWAILGDNTRKK
jgi:hypothetical protein